MVLFAPAELENPDHCVRSILRIREVLTGSLSDLSPTDPAADHLRAMRAACRKFLTAVDGDEYGDDDRIITYGAHRGHHASWVFQSALGELRGVIGVHLAALAALHGLDVGDDLASILPAQDSDEKRAER